MALVAGGYYFLLVPPLQLAQTDAGKLGDFGAGTKKAVIDFQKKSQLVADGVVGPYTWKALEDE